jgi:hypothetical protein
MLDLFRRLFEREKSMPRKRKIKFFAKADSLPEKIKKATEGLYYISETDAEILPFAGTKAEAVTKENLLPQTGNEISAPVEERNFAEFFARLTKIQDWFGDEEKQTAARFAELQKLLEENLKNLKVFKIGRIEIDVYVVGLDAEGNLTGIKTKAVET